MSRVHNPLMDASEAYALAMKFEDARTDLTTFNLGLLVQLNESHDLECTIGDRLQSMGETMILMASLTETIHLMEVKELTLRHYSDASTEVDDASNDNG